MTPNSPRLIERKGSAVVAAGTAGVVLVCIIAVLFLIPEINDSQRDLLRWLIAIGSGAFATFFLGGVALEGTVGNFRIAAGGGFALFLIMLLLVDPLPRPESKQASTRPTTVNPSDRAAETVAVTSSSSITCDEPSAILPLRTQVGDLLRKAYDQAEQHDQKNAILGRDGLERMARIMNVTPIGTNTELSYVIAERIDLDYCTTEKFRRLVDLLTS